MVFGGCLSFRNGCFQHHLSPLKKNMSFIVKTQKNAGFFAKKNQQKKPAKNQWNYPRNF